jgi:hypothetical protein
MNNKTIGIGFFVLGLALTIVFSGNLVGSIPGIIFMIIGIIFILGLIKKK